MHVFSDVVVCHMGVFEIGVPSWGPYYKATLLVGDLDWVPSIFVNPHMPDAELKLQPGLPAQVLARLDLGAALPGAAVGNFRRRPELIIGALDMSSPHRL